MGMTEWRSLNVPGSWVREEEWIGVTPTVTWTQYQPVVMNRAEHVSNAVSILVNLHQHPHLWSRASCSDSKNKAADASGWKVLPVGSLFKKRTQSFKTDSASWVSCASVWSLFSSFFFICVWMWLSINQSLETQERDTCFPSAINTIINPGFHYRLLTHPDLLALCWLN